MTPSAPPPSFPLALEDDADDVAWALRTAGVEWNRGARADAFEWLLRAVDTAIDAGRIERAREIQRNINDLSSALRSSPVPGPGSSPPSHRPRTSSMPPLPPPPGFAETLEAEAIDVDMDVDLDLDEEAEEVESLEVLEAEVLDEEEEAPEEATTQWSVPSSDEQIEEDDIEPIDGGLEVVEESIRAEEEPPLFASEPPTVQNQLAAQGDIPLPLGYGDDQPLADPATLPPGPVRPQPLPRFSEMEAATTAVVVERMPSSPPGFPPPGASVPESGPKPEPFHRSPSFGDHLGPPASVVLRAANAILDADPTIPPAAPAPSPAPPRAATPVPPRAPLMPQRRTARPVPDAAPQSARQPSPPPLPVAPAVVSEPPPSLLGIQLAEVRGLEDLPEESQQDLSRKVRIHALEVDEEVTGFGLALVLSGKVSVMPAIMDVVCLRAGRGELIFAESHVEEGVTLKAVAAEPGTRVAAWPIEQFAEAIAPCPWVRDELRGVGDRLQAFAGAAMGQMGEQLDELLRGMVFERCSVKLLLPGEAVATAGKPLAGMTIVGAGRLEVSDKEGNLTDELGPGDIVYPSEMLRAAPAPANVKAGEGGALIVFADRKTAHELMMSVPPLIEVLSS